MSDRTVLSLRTSVDVAIDVEGLTPDRLAGLDANQIAALPVSASGGHGRDVGAFFAVRGGLSMRITIEGDLSRVHGLGAGTCGGELVIDGDAGDRVGAGMRGGTVHVMGTIGDEGGLSMAGGALRVSGSAGHRLGASAPGAAKGMTGGEIVVMGSAGDETAVRIRRGLIVVGGRAGRAAARDMIAGTLIVFGAMDADSGRGNKRGTIVAVRHIDVPPTYRYACTFEPPYIRLVMTHLNRTHGLPISDDVLGGRFRRYCGDAGIPGKGEILEWIAS